MPRYEQRRMITDVEWLQRRARDLEQWYTGTRYWDKRRTDNIRQLLPLLKECLNSKGEGATFQRAKEVLPATGTQQLAGKIGRAIRTGWLVREEIKSPGESNRVVYHINPYISIKLRELIRQE